MGDFNFDAVVSIADLGDLASNWQATLSPPAPGPTVPLKLKTPLASALPTKASASSVKRAVRPHNRAINLLD
jgi:hypothetical protein